MRPVRSFLFVPGNKASWIEKSVAAKADALILDLEDSEKRLYNLKSDPGETADTSAAEARAAYEMEQALRTAALSKLTKEEAVSLGLEKQYAMMLLHRNEDNEHATQKLGERIIEELVKPLAIVSPDGIKVLTKSK